MITLRLNTSPSEPEPQQRIKEVQLCLEEHLIGDYDLPALTGPCVTRSDVEEEFEHLIALILEKKKEAIAMLAWRENPRKR